MAELDLVRSLPFAVVPPADAARARARGRLLRHARHARRTRRTRLLAPAVGLAVVTAAAAFVIVGRDGNANAAAAVLRRAAAVARQQVAPPVLQRGQFWYSKSVQADLVSTDGKHAWVALGPKVREIWLRPSGGLVREAAGRPRFISQSDREHWIAAGRPQVNPPHSSESLPPQPALNLPSDPDRLYATLHERAVGNANGTGAEMLTEVGDALRETDTTPALRAALYEVAARIPGIELVGPVTDRIGRNGIAVAYSSASGHERHELIFDPQTSALLGEDYRALAGNVFGYPAGTVTGYATYVSTGVVNRVGARPRR